MAGICSRHQGFDPNCHLCKARIEDLLPEFQEKLAEAKAAGAHVCECGFEYYKTVDSCPLCNVKR